MCNILRTSELVKDILEKDKQSRNSDSFLYLKVLSVIGERKGIDINSMSITTFLLHLHEYGFPAFETVRRTRQKLQATYPELAACERVEGFRAGLENEFREFARGEV